MDKEELNIGDLVVGKVKEDMDAPFTGTVEKIYENAALISVSEFDPIDKTNISELNQKIIVNFKHLKPAKS